MLAIAVVGALAGPARAQEPTDDFRPAHNRFAIQYGGGPMLLGPIAYNQGGPELEIGRRLGPIWLFGRGSFMRASRHHTQEDGSDVWRYGGAVRVSLARMGLDRIGGGMHLWADAGIGRRVIYWDAGGRLSRDEASIGVGWDGEATFGRGPHGIGFGLSLRALFAEPVGPQRADPGMLMLLRVGGLL